MALIKVLEWVHRLRHLGCPPMVRRHQDAGRRSRELCHMPDARSLARFPPRLSLSLAFRGRTPALHTARPTAARSGGCGVSSKRRACMGRSLVLEPISRAGNADAPKRREGFAIAQRGATGRQAVEGRTFFRRSRNNSIEKVTLGVHIFKRGTFPWQNCC